MGDIDTTNGVDPAADLPAEMTSAVVQRPEALGIGHLFWVMRDAVVVGEVATGRIALWNPAAERIFGWPAEVIVGAPIERLVPERLREQHRTGLARYAATGQGRLVDGEVPVEVQALRQDGTEITVELSMTPLAGEEPGQCPTHVAVFARDATERVHLDRERAAVLAAARDTARRLEELATMKAHFTAMVAHEFGAPVAAIRALVDLLVRGTISAADQPAVLATIRAEADLVTRLVRDVEGAAAVERDDFTVRLRVVPVAMLVADAVGYARLLSGDHPIGEDIAPEVLTAQVVADPARIGQVLRNLIGNAAKHTPPGTPITLQAQREQDRVRITVADDGPGIAPADRVRILEKFGRGQDAERNHTPGAGLGLYVARRLLAAHDTDLDLATEPGAGSRFGFTLEVAP